MNGVVPWGSAAHELKTEEVSIMCGQVGLDIVYIPRLQRSLARHGLVERVFTPSERQYCRSRPERYAGRWAAKEATLKALGGSLGSVSLQEIEICSEVSGKPRIVLHGRAEELARDAGWQGVSLSISHDGDYATAMVVTSCGGCASRRGS